MPAPGSEASASAGCVDDDTYTENFETGWASDWYLGTGFQIVNAGSGKVLQGAGASSAVATYLFGDYWSDFSLGFKMTLDAGELLASVRYNSNSADLVYDRIKGKATDRYYVGLTSRSVAVVRTRAGTDSTLASASVSFTRGRSYAVKLVVAGGTVSVLVDGALLLSVSDPAPVPAGSIAFETRSNAQVTVDDIEVVATMPCEQTWSRPGSFPIGGDVSAIVVDPRNSDVVYAGTEHQGVWKSTDRGETWSEVGYTGDMGRLGKAYTMAIAPSAPDVVYAGYATDVDKSVDGGLHWTRTGLIDSGVRIQGLAVDPGDANVVYAALGGDARTSRPQGVFTSSDGGRNWTQLGFTSAAFSLAVSASTPTTMYAGSTDGIYRTTDEGITWTRVYNGTASGIFSLPSIAIDPSDADTVYAVADGVVRTTNGGTTWTKVRSDAADQVVIAPSNRNVLYVLAGRSIFKSTNRGDTWSLTTWTVAASAPKAIAVDPSNASRIYLGTWGQGLYFSQDGGATWSAPATRSVPADLGAAIAVDPTDDDKVYVGTVMGEVYVSRDRAVSWTRLVTLGTGSSRSLITGLVVDPRNRDVIYASNVEGVYKSQDGGASWKTITSGLSDSRIISLAIDPQNPSRLFAGSGSSRPRNMTEGSGLFYSSNGGESWSKVQGIPDAPISAIAISRSDTNTMYVAAMAAGIYRSTDGGTSWSQTNSGLRDLCVYTLAVDPRNSAVAYAGTTGNSTYCKTFSNRPDHVYKTENGGADWKVALEGKTVYDTIEGIAIDPSSPDRLYVTNHTEKVWFSADAGATWNRADKGVIRHGAHLYLWAISFDASGRTVYMTTCGRGVLRNDVAAPESCATGLSSTGATFELAGGNGSVSIVAPTSCHWTATSDASWITVTSSSQAGSGDGSVLYLVAANTGATRRGTITIGGRNFLVQQRGS